MIHRIFFTIILLFLFSCSDKTEKKKVEFYYNESLKELKKGNYFSAIDNLEIIESDHPYSNYSVKAEILNAFINYINKDYDLAISAAEKFIKLRPANKYVDYMYFLRAEAYYVSRSDYLREQNSSMSARKSFLQLISRFSKKKYTPYSIEKLTEINNELANYNLDIGRTHLKRGEYIPALKRFENILIEYKKTKYSKEASFRLVETYFALGLIEQAKYHAESLAAQTTESFWQLKSVEFSKLYLN